MAENQALAAQREGAPCARTDAQPAGLPKLGGELGRKRGKGVREGGREECEGGYD